LHIPLKEGIGVKGGSKTKGRQGNFTNNSIVILRQKLSTYSQLSDFYEYDYEILGLPSDISSCNANNIVEMGRKQTNMAWAVHPFSNHVSRGICFSPMFRSIFQTCN
jgi:hypothetical protein